MTCKYCCRAGYSYKSIFFNIKKSLNWFLLVYSGKKIVVIKCFYFVTGALLLSLYNNDRRYRLVSAKLTPNLKSAT